MIQTAPLELGIACSDVARQIAFYSAALDFEVVQRATVPGKMSAQLGLADDRIDFVWMQGPGGERIKFFPCTAGAAPVAQGGRFAERRGIAYLTFYCEDLDATLDRATAAGSKLRSDDALLRPEFDTRIAFLSDPEGNSIELVERADLANYRSDLEGWPRTR